MSLVSIITNAAFDLMSKHAVHSGDGYRQWLYRDIPNDYSYSDSATKLVNDGISIGKSAEQIFQRSLTCSTWERKENLLW